MHYNGVDLRPKFKKIKSLASGSMSVVYNGRMRLQAKKDEVDLDKEQLKLTVALRKEIPYEELNLPEFQREFQRRKAFNNNKRVKMINEILANHPMVANYIKANAKILSNWISYVVRQS